MKAIYWLASYPKSGNTWLRVLLANYRQPDGRPVGINHLPGSIASSRELFEEGVGLDSSELSISEIGCCRPVAYRAVAGRLAAPTFVKVHDAWSRAADGTPIFPPEVSAGVIYIVRNPLDIAGSLAHHRGVRIGEAVEILCDEEARIADAADRLEAQLPQAVGSWSRHARSWIDESHLRVHVVRYEDMLADTPAALCGVLEFAGLSVDEARVAASVEAARFDRLQAQERAEGFVERSPRATRPFFGRGIAGGWRQDLSPDQVRALVFAHGDTMRRFGYLDATGHPV
jgi:hypothetical protein